MKTWNTEPKLTRGTRSLLHAGVWLLAMALIIPATFAQGRGKGSGGGGGGGGGKPGEEGLGNNLSFPVIWADGAMTVPGVPGMTVLGVPWETKVVIDGVEYFAYPQKTEGNVWQAESLTALEPTAVDEIDWGDSLESVDAKLGRPVRIELSMFKLLTLETAMTGYTMAMLANPSSPTEIQGALSLLPPPTTEAVTFQSLEATVYSQNGKLVIQMITGLRENVQPGDLVWEGTRWIDADPTDNIGIGSPITVQFKPEINVGGKVIYGLAEGGWKPTAVGDYRITFYLPNVAPQKTYFHAGTVIRLPLEEEEVVVAAEPGDVGGVAAVDPANNLTFIDVRVGAGGGGGKKGR